MNFLNELKIIRTYLYVLIIGCCIGASTCAYVIYKLQPKSDLNAHITTQTISGANAKIEKITSNHGTTTVDTSYSGAGESNIIIPSDSIPEGYAWNHYVWGVGGSISTDMAYSLLLSYRYQRIQGIGSLWFRNNKGYSAGLSLGAMYLF